MGVFYFPFAQGDPQPEAVDAKGYEGQQPPLDPVSEQLHGFSVEGQAMAVYNSVFDFPSVHHADGPGIADSEGEQGDKDT